MVNLKIRVGSELLTATTGYVRVGDVQEKRRALWFDRAMVPSTDIVFGPDAFLADRVTFVINPGITDAMQNLDYPAPY